MALIVTHNNNESFLGEKPLLELASQKSFSELVFLLLSEREPNKKELKVFELILNLSIDHGPDTPSVKPVIQKAHDGESIGEALASGIKEINDAHGGAQELLMPILYKMIKEKISADKIVSEYKDNGKKIPGFGHRLYKDIDPRAEIIIQTLREEKMGEDYILAARDLQNSIEKIFDKKLPTNVDGAIAVALCAFDFPAILGKPVFIISRIAGLCAHYVKSRNYE